MKFLKERMNDYMKSFDMHFKNDMLNLAMFDLEQYVQLYLKQKLYDLVGEFPKTHSIRKLLREIGKIKNREKEVEDFIARNSIYISDLELAYIASRYMDKEYSKEEVLEIKKFLHKLKNFIEEL